jgi:hypothetical protein
MNRPSEWIEEDREDVVTAIVDGIVSQLTLEQMRQIVWDLHYEQTIWQDWPDLWDLAEDYSPDLLDQFNEPESGLA